MGSTDSSDLMPAADESIPLITLPLRNGTTLIVTPEAIQLDAERFAIDRVQDARRTAPEPETIGLRVAGRGLVEFQPARPGEGALALEAIYRLRPDLRPAGFEAPASTPAWWPPAIVAPSPYGWSPSSGQPSPGTAASPEYPIRSVPSYPPSGMTYPDGRLTPYPRGIMALIGAPFRLFQAHWRAWLLLGLLAAGLPSVVSGALQMALYAVQGYNPWRAIDTGAATLIPTHLPRTATLVTLIILGLAQLTVLLLTSAWQIAVLATAGRRALLGEPLEVRGDVRACLRAGVDRFVPVLLATLALAAGVLLAVGVPLGLLLLASAQIGPNPQSVPSGALLSASLSACLGLVWLLVGAGAVIFGFGRLILAPYIAATQPLDARSALRASWQLTRGHWWHTVAPLVGVGLIVLLLSAPLANVELVSYALSVLVAQPLANIVLEPLVALAAVGVLYDLRLRKEGRDAVLHAPST